jgi:hypothetical protein
MVLAFAAQVPVGDTAKLVVQPGRERIERFARGAGCRRHDDTRPRSP